MFANLSTTALAGLYSGKREIGRRIAGRGRHRDGLSWVKIVTVEPRVSIRIVEEIMMGALIGLAMILTANNVMDIARRFGFVFSPGLLGELGCHINSLSNAFDV